MLKESYIEKSFCTVKLLKRYTLTMPKKVFFYRRKYAIIGAVERDRFYYVEVLLQQTNAYTAVLGFTTILSSSKIR